MKYEILSEFQAGYEIGLELLHGDLKLAVAVHLGAWGRAHRNITPTVMRTPTAMRPTSMTLRSTGSDMDGL